MPWRKTLQRRHRHRPLQGLINRLKRFLLKNSQEGGSGVIGLFWGLSHGLTAMCPATLCAA